MRVVRCDGSPGSVAELVDALAGALDGGPAVFPTHGSSAAPASGPGAGAALVIETSGSTGGPKRVVLSAAALRASAGATHRRLGGPGRWLLALPAQHVAGAQVLVRALLAGHPPAVLDARAGFRAERFAATADALLAATPGERHYTSLVPTQLHRVLDDPADDSADGPAAVAALRRFDAVLVGGAATPPALLERARGAGVAVVTTYGMSETAGGCMYDGVPLDGVRVRLDGPDGRICLAGPMLAEGYLGEPDHPAFDRGWFRTSDLGAWAGEPDGTARLQVLGRADDVIITGGRKVHPAAVERVLTGQPGVRAACVVGLADPEWGQLVAAAVVPDDPAAREGPAGPDVAPATRAEWDRAVHDELGAASVPRLVRTLAELPLRGVGKPDRAAVARLLTDTPVNGHPTH
jgi:O-succinylbenzoic acid--CoA ligase